MKSFLKLQALALLYFAFVVCAPARVSQGLHQEPLRVRESEQVVEPLADSKGQGAVIIRCQRLPSGIGQSAEKRFEATFHIYDHASGKHIDWHISDGTHPFRLDPGLYDIFLYGDPTQLRQGIPANYRTVTITPGETVVLFAGVIVNEYPTEPGLFVHYKGDARRILHFQVYHSDPYFPGDYDVNVRTSGDGVWRNVHVGPLGKVVLNP